MLSVLIGSKVHETRNENLEANDAFLRRAIHRIEKGLIIPENKRNFALDYIYKTCEILPFTYENLDMKSRKWVIDVLEKYFNTVDNEIEIVKKAKKLFIDFIEESYGRDKNGPLSLPFEYNRLKESSIEFNDLLELSKRRHSVRYFKNLKVDKKLIEKAISVGLQSPSACNRQPFELIVVQDEDIIRKVVDLPMGMKTYKDNVKNIAVLVGDLSCYSNERDRHVIYIDGGLFAMSFVYGLEVQGISSCIINWPDIEVLENSFYKEFDLPKYKRCICFIAFGYAKDDGLVPFSEKKAVEDILCYDKYSNR